MKARSFCLGTSLLRPNANIERDGLLQQSHDSLAQLGDRVDEVARRGTEHGRAADVASARPCRRWYWTSVTKSRAVWSDSCREASAWRNPTTRSHSLAFADRRTYDLRSTIGLATDSTTRMPAGGSRFLVERFDVHAVAHERGKGTRPRVVKFQVRPTQNRWLYPESGDAIQDRDDGGVRNVCRHHAAAGTGSCDSAGSLARGRLATLYRDGRRFVSMPSGCSNDRGACGPPVR
jgi:hypothetical protein